MLLWHWAQVTCSLCSLSYSWSAHEIEEAEKAGVLFAADVIYSDDLTDLFFDTMKKLMSRGAKKVSLNQHRYYSVPRS